MKLSGREKTLVTALGVLALAGGIVNFVVLPRIDEVEQVHATHQETKAKYQKALADIDPKNPIYRQFKVTDNKVMVLSSLFFPELKQDKIITILDQCFVTAGVSPKTILFRDSDQSTEKANDKKIPVVTQTMFNTLTQLRNSYQGKANIPVAPAATDAAKPVTESAAADKSKAVQLGATITFDSGYSGLTQFVKAIEASPRRIIVNKITTAGGGTGVLTHTVDISFMAIPKLHDTDKDFYAWEYANPYGTDNPYAAFAGYTRTAPTTVAPVVAPAKNPLSTGDFYLMLNSVNSELTTVVMSRYGDRARSTYLYADNPGFENIELEIVQQEGKFFCRYKTQSGSYGPNYALTEFKPTGSNLVMNVFSQPRFGKEDLCGANISIVNKSNMKLVVNVIDDDLKRPRAKFVKKSGLVDINQ